MKHFVFFIHTLSFPTERKGNFYTDTGICVCNDGEILDEKAVRAINKGRDYLENRKKYFQKRRETIV